MMMRGRGQPMCILACTREIIQVHLGFKASRNWKVVYQPLESENAQSCIDNG